MLDPKLLDQIIDVAAVAAYKSSLFKGKGDKNAADQAAVDAMRTQLNSMNIKGKVVIGEGEMDEAPMLYIGETLGKSSYPKIDIAVDPLDGTRLAAENQPNAISVISISEDGMLLQAPDTYMDKISVGPNLPENIVDLDEDIKKNIKNLAKAKKKNIEDICICILERERHNHFIEGAKSLGSKLKLISDGDVAGSIYSALENSKVDMYLGIGGAPEGVLAASAIKCLGGQFQARLKIQNDEEIKRATNLGIQDFDKKYYLDDLVKGDVIFCSSGVTDGELVSGVKLKDKEYETETFALHYSQKFFQKVKKIYRL
ncbi:MAG: fructose-bisphosphatase class II [Candidatus Pelagibacter sp.]|nr:fructose-bisphosphatase class II [Candidatus Pelagibacter sp.]OUV86599.1 MAG: fructose-bisphosphatase class II [Pelagibacteraceae bacterium TMED136]|tara:strand:- start:1181 stop:2122 length:942 start_codon:yes stop_codon:yes gene_type:complete